MEIVDRRLPVRVAETSGSVQASIRLLGSADARGAGTHDNTYSIGADALDQPLNSLHQAVLLHPQPCELIVPAVQVLQPCR
jgi:hypothetical protein